VIYALVSEHNTAVVAFSQSHVVFCALSLSPQLSECCQPSRVCRMWGLVVPNVPELPTYAITIYDYLMNVKFLYF